MATPLPPPLFGATPSALPNGTIPALAAGDFLTIERKTDGLVFNALVSQFDTRYTTIAQGVLAAAIGVSIQAYSANLDAWAAVAVADYLTIAAGNAAYQPLDADLTAIAALSPTDGAFIVGNGTAWDAESGATVRTSLGLGNVENTALSTWAGSTNLTTLGTIATGVWAGSTIPVNKGGTGQATQQAAIDALTNVSAATDEHVLTKDTASGNAIWKASAGGGGGSTLPVVDETAIVYKTGNEAITATFDANALTAARVYGLPDASTTLAGVAVTQTFTAAQVISVNSTEAFKVEKSSNNTLVVDTTNGRVGINTAPSRRLHIRDTAITNVDALFAHPDGANQDINFYMGIVPTGAAAFDFVGPAGYYGMSGVHPFVFATSNETRMKIQGSGNVEIRKKLSVQDNVMIGDYSVATTAAKLHVDQASTTAAIPVITLDQADVDQVLAKIIGTSDSGAVDRTLVKASDFPTPGAIALWIQIEIEDGRVGGIPAGDYYWPLYAAPS